MCYARHLRHYDERTKYTVMWIAKYTSHCVETLSCLVESRVHINQATEGLEDTLFLERMLSCEQQQASFSSNHSFWRDETCTACTSKGIRTNPFGGEVLPVGCGGFTTGMAASLSSAWERCCPLAAGLLLSLPRSMSSMACSISVAGSSTAVLTVRACKTILSAYCDTKLVYTDCVYNTVGLQCHLQQAVQNSMICARERGLAQSHTWTPDKCNKIHLVYRVNIHGHLTSAIKSTWSIGSI